MTFWFSINSIKLLLRALLSLGTYVRMAPSPVVPMEIVTHAPSTSENALTGHFLLFFLFLETGTQVLPTTVFEICKSKIHLTEVKPFKCLDFTFLSIGEGSHPCAQYYAHSVLFQNQSLFTFDNPSFVESQVRWVSSHFPSKGRFWALDCVQRWILSPLPLWQSDHLSLSHQKMCR